MNTLADQLKGLKLNIKKEKKKMSPSILGRYRRMYQVRTPEEEGVKFINVSNTSKTKLGKRLFPCHLYVFKHVLGSFPSVETFMQYISVTNFPQNLLEHRSRKCIRTKVDQLVKNKKCRRVHIPNFWAVLVEGVWARLRTDKDLLEELKNSGNMIFTSYNIVEKKIDSPTGPVVLSEINYNTNLVRYLGILREIRTILQQEEDMDKVEELIKELVKASMDKPDVPLYAKIPSVLDIKPVEENTTESEEDSSDTAEQTESGVASETDMKEVTGDNYTKENVA